MELVRNPEQLAVAYDTIVIYDDFNQWKPVVQNLMYSVAALGSGASLSTQVIAAFPNSVRLQSVNIVPETTATISSSNTSTWLLKNGSTQIMSTVFNASSGAGAWPTADVLTSLGTIVAGTVQAGGYLTFSITGASGSITPQTLLQIGYVDLSSLPNGWQVYAPQNGNFTLGNTQGGVITLSPSDPNGSAAASDEIYLYQSLNTLEPTAGYPIYFEALIQYTEANTSDAGIFFGLASSFGTAGLITAASAGMKNTGTIIGFYKIDGQTNWSVIAQNGSTNFSEETTIACGTSTYQRLSVEMLDDISGYTKVVFKVDGQLARVASFPQLPYTALLTLSGIANCSIGFGVKNGASVTGGAESLNIDYVGVAESRITGADG